MRGGLPPHVAHVGAAGVAVGRTLVLLQIRLHGVRRAVARGVRRGADAVAVNPWRGCWAAKPQVSGQRSVLLEIAKVTLVTGHAACTRQVDCRGHGHGALPGRGCRHRRFLVRHLVNVMLAFAVRRGKGGSSGGGSLLNSAAVVVLMTCESGAAGEGLLAVGVGALVRPLAGMRAAMTRERAAVTEALSHIVSQWGQSKLIISINEPWRRFHSDEVSLPCEHVRER